MKSFFLPPFLHRVRFSFAFLLSILAFVAIGAISQPAYAVTAGCNNAKWDNLKDLSEVRTAYDVGATEQIIPKPDSVLALSCFSQASQVSADKGGSIFSGNFQSNLNNVISGSLNSMLGNFAGSLLDGFLGGGMAGLVGGLGALFGGGGGAPAFSCNNMQDVWNNVLNSGINSGAKFMDLDQILQAASPVAGGVALPAGTGTILTGDLTPSAGAAANVRTSLNAAPTAIPIMNTDANGSGFLDVCDVMTNLNGGVAPGGC